MRGRIKRTKHDDIFSLCVRAAANWQCRRCSKICPDGRATGRSRRVECSHIFGRRNKSTRWFPNNAICLCTKCHSELGENPADHYDFAIEVLGQDNFDALRVKSNQIKKWRPWELEELYQHFKQQLREIEQGIGEHELEPYPE